MKRIYFVLVVLLNSSFLLAQRDLVIDDRSSERDVFRGNNDEAGLVISCMEDIPLSFVYQHGILVPTQIDTLAGVINYKFKFSTRYKERTITIHAKNYNSLNLIVVLTPKQLKSYYIDDPDIRIINCYYEFTKEGLKLMQVGNYEEAKKKYEASKNCSTINENEKKEADNQLMLIDTLIVWKNMVNTYFTDADYLRTIEYCNKILSKNSMDKFIRTRNIEAKVKQSEICRMDFMKAEDYFEDDDLENAKIFYKRVISLGGDNAFTTNAKLKLQKIERIEMINKQLSHVLTYEYSENIPIGISTGNYKEHKKVSGYFTLRLNTEVFEAFRSNNSIESKPELDVSFGWTIKIVKPIWLFFGPGYTGVGEYIYKEEDINTEEDITKTPETTLKIHNAISPEVGLLGKIKVAKGIGIALRYTFQYRFALKKDTEDYMGKTKHIFGVGFCF